MQAEVEVRAEADADAERDGFCGYLASFVVCSREEGFNVYIPSNFSVLSCFFPSSLLFSVLLVFFLGAFINRRFER